MTITNGYTTLAVMRTYLGITDSDEDALIEAAIESASRSIDRETHRQFWLAGSATARTFAAHRCDVLYADDFTPGTAPVVKSDDNADGTFETTWTVGTDYQLEPLNYAKFESGPQYIIRSMGTRGFPVSAVGRAQVEVTAKWGWPATPASIVQATKILAEDLFKMKDAPFGVAGATEFGVLRVRENAAVAMLIDPYRRPGGVA